MTYISQQNTAFQNLTALANLAHPFTKECHDVWEAKNREFFATKMNACQISAVCLVILGVVTAVATHVAAGILVGSLVVVPIGLYLILQSKSAKYDEALKPHVLIINDIARQVAGYILDKRKERLDVIHAVNRGPVSGHSCKDVGQKANNLLAQFTDETLAIDNKDFLKGHTAVRKLAVAVINRQFAKDDLMLFAQTACHKYVFGESGNHFSIYQNPHNFQYYTSTDI